MVPDTADVPMCTIIHTKTEDSMQDSMIRGNHAQNLDIHQLHMIIGLVFSSMCSYTGSNLKLSCFQAFAHIQVLI